MNFTALFTFLTIAFKSKKPHVAVILLTIIISCAYIVWGNINQRVSTLEFSDRSTCQKLDSINDSLIRIETGVDTTKKEVSDLKTALILKK